MALGLLVVVAFVVGWTQGSFASTALPAGTGELQVAGERYQFSTDTCSVTDDGFVVSGPGTADGERFWISASNYSIDITVGTESIAQAPADDNLWLTSFNEVDWATEESALQASAQMWDERVEDPARHAASLSINCGPVT